MAATSSSSTTAPSRPTRSSSRPAPSRCRACLSSPSAGPGASSRSTAPTTATPQDVPAGPVLVVGGGNTGFQIAEELAAHPRGAPVDRVAADATAAADPRPRPVPVARRHRADEQDGRLEARATDASPRHADRLEPTRARAGMACSSAGRTSTPPGRGPLRRRRPAHPRRGDLGHRLCARPLVRPRSRCSTTTATSRTSAASPPRLGSTSSGLPWQHTRGSALLGWVKDDAEHIARHIATHEVAAQSGAGWPRMTVAARRRVTADHRRRRVRVGRPRGVLRPGSSSALPGGVAARLLVARRGDGLRPRSRLDRRPSTSASRSPTDAGRHRRRERRRLRASSSSPPRRSPDRRGCSSSAWPATDSRTSGSTAATSSRTPAGGRRSASSSTGSSPPSSPSEIVVGGPLHH